jgi:hypothetical protein
MPTPSLHREIARKGASREGIARKVVDDPTRLEELAEGLAVPEARIKYGCARVFLILSDTHPSLVYPTIDLFLDLLDSENNILRWTAIGVVANLATVDTRGVIEKNFDRFFSPINGPALVTAANVIAASAKIALAKPHLVGRITKRLLSVQKAKYGTAECRKVALGHTVRAFDVFYDLIGEKEPVLKLVRSQTRSSRGGTRKAAQRFLRKHRTNDKGRT